MASIKQTPSQLDIYIVRGNDFTFSIHSSSDLSGYKLSAYCGDMKFQITPVTEYDYNVFISRQQTSNIIKEKNWYMDWIDINGEKRTIIKGVVKTQ